MRTEEKPKNISDLKTIQGQNSEQMIDKNALNRTDKISLETVSDRESFWYLEGGHFGEPGEGRIHHTE